MILIIRPEKETERVVKDLSERQYQFLLEPLSIIKIKDFDIRHNTKYFYLISSIQSVTSIKNSIGKNKQLLNDGKFFVIGKKTSNNLKQIGAKNILDVFYSSEEFINFVRKNKNIKTIVHLTGSVLNKTIDDFSKNDDISILKIILYDVLFNKQLTPDCRKLIQNKKINSMFHYSLKSAEVFLSLLNNNEKKYFFSSVRHFCLSKRIASGLIDAGVEANVVYSSKMPDHESLMLQFDHTYKNDSFL